MQCWLHFISRLMQRSCSLSYQPSPLPPSSNPTTRYNLCGYIMMLTSLLPLWQTYPTLCGRNIVFDIHFSSIYFTFASRSVAANVFPSKNLVLDEKFKAFLDTYNAPHNERHCYWTGLLLALLLVFAVNDLLAISAATFGLFGCSAEWVHWCPQCILHFQSWNLSCCE